MTARNVTVPADFYTIPLHVRGGYIIPMQQPALTTYLTRQNPFSLLVALDQNNAASGVLYWDDGISLNVGSKYLLANFTASYVSTSQSGKIVSSGTFGYTSLPMLQNITVYGTRLKNTLFLFSSSSSSSLGLSLVAPQQVLLNGKTVPASQYSFNATSLAVSFVNLGISLSQAWNLVW